MTVGPVQPDARVRGDADRLVDDHDVVVVVDDRHAGHRLGDQLGAGRGAVLGQRRPPATRRRRTRSDLPTERRSSVDRAGGGQVGGLGAGEAEQPGERGVDALALEAVGDGQGRGRQPSSLRVPVGATCLGGRAAVPRRRRRRRCRAARGGRSARPPSTMAESARLKIGQCGSCDEVHDVPAAGPGRRGRSGR